MGSDEVGTFRGLTERRAVLDALIASHRGRIANPAGDSVLAEFASAVDAVQCAVAAQGALAEANAGASPDRHINFRIGVHVGDVMVKGGDLFGDGVNITARLQTLAAPGGVSVSGAAYDHVRKLLPFKFTDLGAQQVKNIEEPVRVYAVSAAKAPITSDSSKASDERKPLSLPDKPSIAVLPFQNMSGDPEQEYFADGMVEEIITALSRIRWLFVIARNSSSTYKGRSVGVKQVGRELGVRYVLEGSVRKGGNRVRITAQLIEAETGAHLWADRFDGSLEDVFDLQDKVAINVAGVIEPALQAAEVRRSVARPTHDVTAYDLYLRALATYYPITKDRLLEAVELLHQAIAIDRYCGPALSLAAMCRMRLSREGWAEEPEAAGEAVDLARQALQVAGDDPGILANAAFVLANFGEDIGAMMALVDRALTLTPSFSRGWFLSGVLRLWAGQHDLAIEHAETALRLSPGAGTGAPLGLIGEAHFFKRAFDEAAAQLPLR